MASENPYCMRCGQHLGIPYHETNEHDAARRLADRDTAPSADRTTTEEE